MNKKTTTMQKIALELGLSRNAVSSVLNGKAKERRISQKTVDRVMAYVEKTGYHQDIGALSMRGKYSKDIGIVTSAMSSYLIHNTMLLALGEYLNSRNISYVTFQMDKKNFSEIIQQIKLFGVKRLIVFCSSFESPDSIEVLETFRSNLKEVVCYIHDARPSLLEAFDFAKYGDVVNTIDRPQGYELIASLMMQHEYKKIILPYGMGDVKKAISAWENAGMEVCVLNLLSREKNSNLLENNSFAYGRSLAAQLKNYPFDEQKTAIYVHDDFTATAMLRAFLDYGFRIPGDFGVISWDNNPFSEYASVPLTSVGLPHDAIIEHMFLWIDKKLESGTVKKFHIVRNNGRSI